MSDSIVRAIKSIAESSKKTTPNIFDMAASADQNPDDIVELSLNGQTAIGSDGVHYPAIISGSPNRVTSGLRLPNGSMYVPDEQIHTTFLGGGSKAFLLTGGYPSGGTHTSGGKTYATAWPLLTVFNIQDQTNYWAVPADATFDVFAPYTNIDVPLSNGHDGVFYAALKSDMSELAIIRMNTFNQFAVGPTPSYDVTWTVLKGLGFDSVNNLVTWTSVENGAVTIPYPGPVLNFHIFQLNAMPYWKANGDFDFDVIGGWDSQTLILERNGIAYGHGMTTGTCAILENYFFTGQSIASTFRIYAAVRGTIAGILAFQNDVGDTANTMTQSTDLFWCHPALTMVDTFAFGTLLVFDTTRAYLYTLDPLLGDITGGNLKMTGDGRLTALRTTFGTGVITPKITTYSWNTLTGVAVQGKEVSGSELPYTSFPATPGHVPFQIMDWLIK